MHYISRFIKDTAKYWEYVRVAAKAELKCEVAGSHLSWLWWILDPLLFMLIYTFVSVIVFGRTQEYLASFIFIGLSSWDFFQHVVRNSVIIVSRNDGILSKVYLPKYVLIYIEMLVWGFKMLIAYLLIAITMLLYRIPLSWRLLFIVPMWASLAVITFGCSAILMHFGVFVRDLANIINALLRLVFYVSGVFYSIDRISEPYRTILMSCNPMALIMDGLRQCMIYSANPKFLPLVLWTLFGVLLSAIGVATIYRNENTYVKVM